MNLDLEILVTYRKKKFIFTSFIMVRERDVCWEYGEKLDGNKVRCRLCSKIFNGGGISRLKNHLSGTPNKDVTLCPDVRQDIVERVRSIIKFKEEAREARDSSSGKRPRIAAPRPSEIPSAGKAIASLDSPPSISRFIAPSTTVGLGPGPGPGPGSGPGPGPGLVDNSGKGKEKENAERSIARFFLENNLDFDVARSSSYQQMLDAVSKCGQGFKGPSSETLRTTWLQRLKSEVKEKSKAKVKGWEKTGCTIVANGWTDNKTRALINFLASSPTGSLFLKSVDASSYFKNEKYLFDLFDSVIQEVGSENVVQIITDYSSNYAAVGKLIMQKYNNIFWAPCASHCLELIFEDIAKLDWVSRCIIQAQSITKFIYNQMYVLDLMRKFTDGKDIVCPCITKFATDFMSLQALSKQKSRLKQMFNSPEYLVSPCATKAQSLSCADVIASEEFWKAVEEIVVVSKALLEALREVEGGKPAVGSIYESMAKVREGITSCYTKDESKRKVLLEIVDRRWKKLHSPLHAVGAYLNPRIQYNPEFKMDPSLKDEFFKVLMQLLPTPESRQNISNQTVAFKSAEGMFGYNIAIESRDTLLPANWWEEYGDSAPCLQRVAVRILSQICSISICKQNWSTFQQVQSKKNNNLDKETLNDLVYINYNLKLEALAGGKTANVDPIVVDDLEMISEWVEETENSTHLHSQEWLDQFDSTAYCGDLNTRLVDGSVFD